jgi:hypothetical protein
MLSSIGYDEKALMNLKQLSRYFEGGDPELFEVTMLMLGWMH